MWKFSIKMLLIYESFQFFWQYKLVYYFRQAYLARLQGSPSGMIAWKVDLTSSDLVIDEVTITAKVTTTETGRVDWKLVGDDEDTQRLDFSNGVYFTHYMI